VRRPRRRSLFCRSIAVIMKHVVQLDRVDVGGRHAPAQNAIVLRRRAVWALIADS
jgi:hypothetical protein